MADSKFPKLVRDFCSGLSDTLRKRLLVHVFVTPIRQENGQVSIKVRVKYTLKGKRYIAYKIFVPAYFNDGEADNLASKFSRYFVTHVKYYCGPHWLFPKTTPDRLDVQ